MAETKNKCPKCGGRLVAEYNGTYGDIYLIGKTGVIFKRRFKRCIYEHDGDAPMIYCFDCGTGIENCGQDVKLDD